MANPIEDLGAHILRAVTPSDTVPLPSGTCRALWIGAAGNVAIKTNKDITDGNTTAVTIVGVNAGQVLPIRALFVMSTNTTATSIVALY